PGAHSIGRAAIYEWKRGPRLHVYPGVRRPRLPSSKDSKAVLCSLTALPSTFTVSRRVFTGAVTEVKSECDSHHTRSSRPGWWGEARNTTPGAGLSLPAGARYDDSIKIDPETAERGLSNKTAWEARGQQLRDTC